ncbi:hypothetical protein ACTFIY_012176 [Dictyostelium cf. discoideum]
MNYQENIANHEASSNCAQDRRGLPSSGDVDILLSHPNYTLKMKDKKETFHIVEKLVDSLKKSGIIIDDLSLGPFKYMGICKLPSNIKLDNIDCKKENNGHCSDNDDDDDDVIECSTKKRNNEEDATSDGEEFEDDSDATEPEDESKRLPPKKILKKKTLKLEKENIKKPKTTTTTTTTRTISSKNNENNNKTNNNNNNNTHTARRIDFKLIPIESYYFGLLHNTGSDEFNRQMRAIALSKGYTLSEYSINKFSKESGKDDQIIPVNSEEEIFKIIGMKYYPPQERKL